jgi:hypothetical protein
MKTELNMKKPIFLTFGLALLLSSFTIQSGIDDVIAAMKSGSASALAKYFDNYVDLTMPDKSNNYSKSQAELILKDFFSNNEVKGFEVKHKGSNDNGEYCIGTLHTKNGNFRATVYMRLKGNKQVIQDIRIQ